MLGKCRRSRAECWFTHLQESDREQFIKEARSIHSYYRPSQPVPWFEQQYDEEGGKALTKPQEVAELLRQQERARKQLKKTVEEVESLSSRLDKLQKDEYQEQAPRPWKKSIQDKQEVEEISDEAEDEE